MDHQTAGNAAKHAAARVAALVVTLLACSATRSPLPPNSARAATPDAAFRAAPPGPLAFPSSGPEEIRATRLANGVQVYILPRPGVSLASVLYVNHNAGDAERTQNSELPALVAATLLRGTERADGEVSNLEVGGAAVRARVLGEGTYLSVDLLASGAAKAVEVLGAVVQHPALKDDGIDAARLQAVQVMSQRSNQLSALSLPFILEAAFGASHPYPKQVDEVKALQTLQMADVRRYYDEHYRPNGSTVVVVGDVDLMAIESAVERTFGAWSNRSPLHARPAPPVVTSPRSSRRVYALWNDGPLSAVTVFLPGVPAYGTEGPVVEVLSHMLERRLRARLRAELQGAAAEERGLLVCTYAIRGMHVLQVSTVVHNSRVADAAQLIFDELDHLRDHLTARELEFSKSWYAQARARSTTAETAFALARADALHRPVDWIVNPERELAALDLDGARRVARGSIRPDGAIVLFTGDERRTRSQLRRFGRVESFTIASH